MGVQELHVGQKYAAVERIGSQSTQEGAHRKRQEPFPIPGMMLHQDGSTHEWVPDKKWDLIVTMDDATNEQYSMFFAPSVRYIKMTMTPSLVLCQLRRVNFTRTERRE